ncbi:hypothetical protein F4802DRAFT_574626 [Xylaria palmicola]|nr:hypothetical protein F4802DRAFT_574626 [Xylaria palmicola]
MTLLPRWLRLCLLTQASGLRNSGRDPCLNMDTAMGVQSRLINFVISRGNNSKGLKYSSFEAAWKAAVGKAGRKDNCVNESSRYAC